MLDNRKSRLLIEALTHSNWIEWEYSVEALRQSLEAFEYLDDMAIANNGDLTINIILSTHGKLMIDFLPVNEVAEFRDCAVLIGGKTKKNVGKVVLKCQVEDWIEKWKNLHTNPDDESYIKKIKKAHIEFEQLHPFADGNGRIGRMLMNWQALKAGVDPIVIKVEDRQSYYSWFGEQKI